MLLKSKIILASTLLACNNLEAQQERPNFLWITCEDISPYLGSYGCQEALTPTLDRLAAEGVRYTHAYAVAPVCAVSRSAILTGMHSTTIGTHQMRSVVQLPEFIPAYSKEFRKAGYYCTNNAKEDYNSNYMRNPEVWDESSTRAHYNKRAADQSFFAVFNILETHESRLNEDTLTSFYKRGLLPREPHISSASINLPPYHPNLAEIRDDWVRLHELIRLMDDMVAERLRELDESGQADNTIVFFYSDHGGMLARSKRYIYNVGTQVPLIVRFPEKWQHLAPGKPGSTVSDLVSLMDLPKTAISVAGLPVPELMQGRIIFGPNAEQPPSTMHFYRDRMSERYDFSRAVTDGRYYYIRNFMPHRPNGRDITYGYDVQANWRAWREYYEKGNCDEIQSQFFQPKPVIEFFDTQTDPWHVENLVDNPAYIEKIKFLEDDLNRWMIETRDIGLIPEPMFYELIGPDKKYKTLYEFANSEQYKVEKVLYAARQASLGETRLKKDYLKYCRDANPAIRYWGAYGLFLVRMDNPRIQKTLTKMLENDPFAANRIMAAQSLALCGNPESAFNAIFTEAKKTNLAYVFLQALNAFQYGHVDSFLSLEDWKMFSKKTFAYQPGIDNLASNLYNRLIEDAMISWPESRPVD